MIRIKKRAQIPQTLVSKKVMDTKKKLEEKVKSGSRPNNEDKDFPSHWLDDDVRLKIWEDQDKKCCYCERERDAKREADIEHFRPRVEVHGEPPGSLGYWWLAYSWSNLLFSCKGCNQGYKKTHFPLLDGGVRAKVPSDSLKDEEPVLINPSQEDPEDFLDYTWEPSAIPLAKPIGRDSDLRGKRTIEILGLDRRVLNEQRGSLILNLEGVARQMHAALYFGNANLRKQACGRIREETESRQHNQFVGFRREYFRKVGLGEYVASD